MRRIKGVPVVIASVVTAMLALPALAAELLDVKPVGAGAGTVIEVTADIPMTYTYYKIPGQARAVVDIADADPEKVEPLIVVNKGAVASISVDKAMLGDMTVSRLVFNLVTETDISVTQAPDKKSLTVSFGSGKQAAADPAPAATPAPPAPVVAPSPPVPAAPVVAVEAKASVAADVSKSVAKEDDDPLGLDEPQPAAPSTKPAQKQVPASPPVKSAKLEPVVPGDSVKAAPVAGVVVKGIVVGASSIDIQTVGAVEKFKQLKLTKPERLSIEIPGTSKVKVQTIQVKRFGISKVRVGAVPGSVRIVLDAAGQTLPVYEVATTENGLKVIFK